MRTIISISSQAGSQTAQKFNTEIHLVLREDTLWKNTQE